MLLEIKQLIDKRADQSSEQYVTELKQLSDEFYSHLPHNNKHHVVIHNKQLIANKQQLCQVYLNSYAFASDLVTEGILFRGCPCVCDHIQRVCERDILQICFWEFPRTFSGACILVNRKSCSPS